MSSTVDVPKTFGALLLGALLACALSGVVAVQCSIYFKSYPSDEKRVKLLVSTVWILDLCHSAFITSSIWNYLIDHYGQTVYIDHIPWSVPLTIILTAMLTFLVHMFFAHRLYRLSRGQWWIVGPVALLALLRLASACVTGSEMFRLGTFSDFAAQYRWVFTLGLAISSAVDVLIAGFLCYFLKTNRTGSISLNKVMDALLLYTVENGAITCTSTVVSLACWLAMPHNRIFLGLHFVISKLYANSLLATLNARQQLRHGRSKSDSGGLPVIFPDGFTPEHNRSRSGRSAYGQGRSTPSTDQQISSKITSESHALNDLNPGQRLQISVVKTIEERVDTDTDPIKPPLIERESGRSGGSDSSTLT